jgi:hypothetical protein
MGRTVSSIHFYLAEIGGSDNQGLTPFRARQQNVFGCRSRRQSATRSGGTVASKREIPGDYLRMNVATDRMKSDVPGRSQGIEQQGVLPAMPSLKS